MLPLSFNSTLVQLKVAVSTDNGGSWKSFNSTLVQLKACTLARFTFSEKCFNSTLVQLKGGCDYVGVIKWVQFQFYLSSIKRLPFPDIGLTVNQFQFYLSSIKREL